MMLMILSWWTPYYVEWRLLTSKLHSIFSSYDAAPFLPEKKTMGIFCLHILGSAFPVMLTIYHGEVFYAFFGPLLGRTGTQLPGDYVMAVLSAFLVFVCCSYFVSTVLFNEAVLIHDIYHCCLQLTQQLIGCKWRIHWFYQLLVSQCNVRRHCSGTYHG